MRRIPIGPAVWASGCAAFAVMTLVACNRGRETRHAVADSAANAPFDTVLPQSTAPALPKVPFNQQPCQSLSAADMAALNFPTPVHAEAFKETSVALTYDNACRWSNGGSELTRIAYQTKEDYDGTSQNMKSTENVAPADIPGAFYDKQGYLWIAKNGYYVEIGATKREPVARQLVGKL